MLRYGVRHNGYRQHNGWSRKLKQNKSKKQDSKIRAKQLLLALLTLESLTGRFVCSLLSLWTLRLEPRGRVNTFTQGSETLGCNDGPLIATNELRGTLKVRKKGKKKQALQHRLELLGLWLKRSCLIGQVGVASLRWDMS